MSKFDRNRIKHGWEKLCTNKQTDRHYENNGHLAVNQLVGSLTETSSDYSIKVGVEKFDLGTVTDDNLQVVLGVARSDRDLMNVIHLTEISHHRLRAGEQLTQVAHEPVFPSQAHTQNSTSNSISVSSKPAYCTLILLVGHQKEHPAGKELSDEMPVWLVSAARCKWSAYGPADATVTPSSLASLNSRLVRPFWCRITQVVLERRLVQILSVCHIIKAFNVTRSKSRDCGIAGVGISFLISPEVEFPFPVSKTLRIVMNKRNTTITSEWMKQGDYVWSD